MSTDGYINEIENSLNSLGSYLIEIEQKNQAILDKQHIQLNQLKEIQDKEKLLLTRSRMLQISQDRNSYKKKVIYTLIAIIFGLFILILFMYVLFTRRT